MRPQRKTSSPKRPQINDNFLEALREMPGDFGRGLAADLVAEIPPEAAAQVSGQRRLSGELKLGQDLALGEEIKTEAAGREHLRGQFHQEIIGFRQREQLVFTHRQQESTLRIKALQQELARLAEATYRLDQEVKVAAIKQPVAPGVYHENFLERLLSFVQHLRKQISESASWLALQNHRAKRTSYYWNQVGTSGTKFMLSQERYAATQAG